MIIVLDNQVRLIILESTVPDKVENVRLIPAQLLSDFAGHSVIEEFQLHQAFSFPLSQGLTQDLFLFLRIQRWQTTFGQVDGIGNDRQHFKCRMDGDRAGRLRHLDVPRDGGFRRDRQEEVVQFIVEIFPGDGAKFGRFKA